jgi:hypothetical protein
MRRALILCVVAALLGAAALAAASGPAFSSDNGSVVATVNVAPPPAPCITLSTTAVDFGTLSFADPAAASTPLVTASPAVHVTSCSTADEKLMLAASDATTTSGGTWHDAAAYYPNTCSAGPNAYEPQWSSPTRGGLLYNTPTQITPTLLAAQGFDVRFLMRMPCRGSAGAGETATMTFTTLAVLA